MPESGCHEHECWVSVREASYDTSPSSYLTHDPLERVVGPDVSPMLVREMHVLERLRDPVSHNPAGLGELHLCDVTAHIS